jgi:hypothetical protein
MKQDFPALWAESPATQRREPTNLEMAGGFPCGPLDLSLHNELTFRLAQVYREVATVIARTGQTPNTNNTAQLWAGLQGMALARAGADTSATANQIVIPTTAPSLTDVLSDYQIYEIIPAVSVTGSATIRLGTFSALPLQRRDGAAFQDGDAPAGQPFLVVKLGSAFRRLDPTPSELRSFIGTPQVIQTILTQFYATPATYWRLDSPSTVIPANASTTIGNYANVTQTVGSGTSVNATTGKVTIGPSDGGTYVLTATNAMDVPTTEETITIVLERGGAAAIAISRGPYPAPGNNANDQSTTAVIRLQPGDVIRVDYIQTNPNNSPSNTLNQPLGHFGGVRVGG